MHRFFVQPEQIRGDDVTVVGDQARQMARVLRLGRDDDIIVLDGLGQEYSVTLTAVSAERVTGRVQRVQPAAGEPNVALTLYQALLKRDKFEWVLQKATEVGVVRIVPVVTQRTLVQDTRLKANKVARWQKILMEAAEQSRRGVVPTLAEPLAWKEALADASAADLTLIAWEEGDLPLKQVLISAEAPHSVALLIGPEGGFSAEEAQQVAASGGQIVSLGARILRTETAAVVASALVLHELESA